MRTADEVCLGGQYVAEMVEGIKLAKTERAARVIEVRVCGEAVELPETRAARIL
jgi:hypothetical protein